MVMKWLHPLLGWLFPALALVAGCSKNTICLEAGATPEAGGAQPETQAALVTFHASVESRNLTRALSPVRKNVQAVVYAFASSASGASGTPLAHGAYISATPGQLQGLDGYKMYLPAGVYDFYAVSDNTAYTPPTFAGGRSEPLRNETDYLWWRGVRQDVTSTQAGVPIVFLHCAAQVVFEVAAGAGTGTAELVLAHLYPPAPGARMDLSTGTIPPATTYAATVSKMVVSGGTAQYILLPVQAAAPLVVSFDVRIDGQTTPRTYQVSVPLPDGQLKAGNSYRFKAVIRGNEVVFPSVSVTNWVDVDETGKPLYPSEM